MKLYKYSIVRTDKYFYEVEAENADQAQEKFEALEDDEFTGKKNLDISTNLESVEDIEEEYEADHEEPTDKQVAEEELRIDNELDK